MARSREVECSISYRTGGSVKTFLSFDFERDGAGVGEPECHRENREEDIVAIQVRGAAGLIPRGGKQRSVGLWPFLKAE